MSKPTFLLKISSLIVLIAALVLVYVFIVIPSYSQWGTTAAERTQAMPGDDIVRQPNWDYTQAVTIQAPVGEVWPWLVQIGQGRGGLYSFELLENMIGCDIHNANLILPEFQRLVIGDSIRLHPKAPGIPVALVDSAHTLVLGAASSNQRDAGSWAFRLDALEPSATRLIARFRSGYTPTLSNILMQRIFVQPTSLFMQKRMLLGLKQRAEGNFRTAIFENIQVSLWLFLGFLLLLIGVSILLRRHWIRLFCVGLVTGCLLWLFIAWQPPVFLGMPLVILNLFLLGWAYRRSKR
jgi:hypothetical protein